MRETFKKAERLSSKKIIERLFAKGSAETISVFGYPFRVLYLSGATPPDAAPVEPQPPAILISVSKRYFKKAVDRNLIKRRIREAYRRNKGLLFEGTAAHPATDIALIYVAKEKISFDALEKKLKFVLKQIAKATV
ncbi:MAG: ribonuclease P protein component [Cytophagaceae bacterium]|nr:ribonuclease P protein component [Cytophagaceae bacterium]